MQKMPLILFAVILLFTTTAASPDIPLSGKLITVNSPSGDSAQKVINDALQQASSQGGGTVYLTAGTYLITDSIYIGSNTVLTGDKNAIVKVSPSSSQFFTGSKGIICTNSIVDNIEIYGFQIDGSCNALPFNYHHSRADTAHDCERAIIITGQTGRFFNNIIIHDMQISDCFSDGIHVRMATNVHCYSNFISNCQHEGIFWVSVKNGLMESNSIAGITSDCARIDNGVTCVVKGNYFYSYTGNHNSQAPEKQHKGIQIADSGASHGYDGSNKPTHTTDIEVYGNTFVNTGTQAVWLDSTGKGYDNVYIHDNSFLDIKAFTNPGHPVSLNIASSNTSLPNFTSNYTDMTSTIRPSTNMSHQIFNSVFDFLHINSCIQAGTNDTVILPEGVPKNPSEATGIIEYIRIAGDDYTLIGVPSEGFSEIQYSIDGKTETHTRMLGQDTGKGIKFESTSVWEGDFSTNGDWVQINGKVPAEKISIKCLSPVKTLTPSVSIVETSGDVIRIEPGVIVIIVLILTIFKIIKFFVKDWFF